MNYRAKLIKLVTFIGGLYFFLEFVLPAKIGTFQFDSYHEPITNGFQAFVAMSLGLGLINIIGLHGGRVVFKRSGWFNSLALLLGLGLMLAVSWSEWQLSERNSQEVHALLNLRDFALKIAKEQQEKHLTEFPAEVRVVKLKEAAQKEIDRIRMEMGAYPGLPEAIQISSSALDSAQANQDSLNKVAAGLGAVAQVRRDFLNKQYEQSRVKRLYELLYVGLFSALGTAMFSLLGFYIASAAYRAFRVRSGESALMMIAAVGVMLGQIPFGIWLWDGFPELRLWLLTVPSAAAFRAIKFGAAVAALVMAFRMWLSIESESFKEDEA